MVSYLLVLDTINFCFWPKKDKPRWEIPYKSGWLSGYYALAVALKTALESGIPLANAEYLASLTLDQLQADSGRERGTPTYAGTSRKPARFGRASPERI